MIDKDMIVCEALQEVSKEMNYIIFTCEKCGMKVRVEAPHLAESQAKKLHKCKEVKK